MWSVCLELRTWRNGVDVGQRGSCNAALHRAASLRGFGDAGGRRPGSRRTFASVSVIKHTAKIDSSETAPRRRRRVLFMPFRVDRASESGQPLHTYFTEQTPTEKNFVHSQESDPCVVPVPLIVLPKSCSCKWGPCPRPIPRLACLFSFFLSFSLCGGGVPSSHPSLRLSAFFLFQGWEGMSPPQRDSKERGVVLAVAHPWASASSYLSSQFLANSRSDLHAASRSSHSRRSLSCVSSSDSSLSSASFVLCDAAACRSLALAASSRRNSALLAAYFGPSSLSSSPRARTTFLTPTLRSFAAKSCRCSDPSTLVSNTLEEEKKPSHLHGPRSVLALGFPSGAS